MPTSNGQVGRYDIRRGAVVETALVDEVISTAKLQDLAVTIDKNEDYVLVESHASSPGTLTTITTSFQEVTSVLIDIPTWAGRSAFFIVGSHQVSNASGSTFNPHMALTVGETDPPPTGIFDGTVISIPHNETQTVVRFFPIDLAAPGTTVEAILWTRINSGTSTAWNQGDIWAQSIFTR